MIEAVSPEVIGGGALTAAAAAGVALRYYRKGGTVEADIDGDGEPDVSVSSGETVEYDTVDSSNNVALTQHDQTTSDPLTEAEVDAELEDLETAMEDDPTIGLEDRDLESVKGIGATRAADLREHSLVSPVDLYYASDNTITEVSGIGVATVEQIRSDIGGIDYE